MLVRIFPQKDTTITNYQRYAVPQTASNLGASEILEVFKRAGMSGAIGVTATSSLAHTLTKFDLTLIQQLTGSGLMPANGVTYRLHMSDAQHEGGLPTSYDIEVQATSQDWDEGKGRDNDDLSDKGFANWERRTQAQYWDLFGASGTFVTSQHFDEGHEDLDVDVTDQVNSWLASGSNYGFLVKVSSSLEADGNDYYRKMFHARNTHFPDRRPYIEARWDDHLQDDRNNFFWGTSGTLYLYNVVRGQLTNITGDPTQLGVKISDLSGTVKFVTGSATGLTGIYSASFAVPTGSYSGSLFSDAWFNLAAPGQTYMTGAFGIGDNFARQDLSPTQYFVSVPDLRNSYEGEEDVRLDLYVRPRDYDPAQVLTGSLSSLGTVVTKAYYRIINDRTEDVVVPFSTGALEYTRLSYDRKGNFFRFRPGSLSPGQVYRITFLFDVDGQRQFIDQGFKFKVV